MNVTKLKSTTQWLINKQLLSGVICAALGIIYIHNHGLSRVKYKHDIWLVGHIDTVRILDSFNMVHATRNVIYNKPLCVIPENVSYFCFSF